MGDLQDILDGELKKVPRLLLKELVTAKIKGLGYDSPRFVDALCRHLLKNDGTNFHWGGDDLPTDLVIKFTDEDISALDAKIEKATRLLPKMVTGSIDPIASSLLKSLYQSWPAEFAAQQADMAGFRARLEDRWGKALRPLRMILTIGREYAGNHISKGAPGSRTTTREVLFQLHIRGCQIAAEIVALLEGGFADGAMARWRTLHEISTVALVIADAGDDAAQRYLDHEVIETHRQMHEFQRFHAELGYEPLTDKELAKVEAGYQAALNRHGPEFRHQYGWAAKHLNLKKPTFIDLEEAAGRAHDRPFFQMASYNVHATPRALSFRLGLFGGRGFLAGASNAGLSDPARNTAHTLTLLTSLLMPRPPELDDIVTLKILVKLRDEMPALLHRAETKLKRDEERFQAGEAKKAKRRAAGKKSVGATT